MIIPAFLILPIVSLFLLTAVIPRIPHGPRAALLSLEQQQESRKKTAAPVTRYPVLLPPLSAA